MTSTNASPQPAMARPVPPLLYPTLLIAGIVVIIASLLGIAAMTGMLPLSQAETKSAAPWTQAAPANGPATSAAHKSASTTVAAAGTARCDDCGVVDTIRTVEAKGQGSGVGAVAGGVVGGILGNQVGGGRGRTAMTVVGAGAGAYAGHELEKNINKSVSYEIRVRMDDSSYRVFHLLQPAVGVGQRVKVRDGQLVRAG